MINPLEDDGRPTLMSTRFETPQFLTDKLFALMEEFLASLPEDDPARELHCRLSAMTPEEFLGLGEQS